MENGQIQQYDPLMKILTTKSIRVTLNKQANDTNGVGVMEWEGIRNLQNIADENDKGRSEKGSEGSD